MHHKKHSTSKVCQKLHMLSSPHRYSVRKHGQAVEKEGTGLDLKEHFFPAPLEEEIQARVPKGDFCSHHSETCKILKAFLFKEFSRYRSRRGRVKAYHLFSKEGAPYAGHVPFFLVLKKEYPSGQENLPEPPGIGKVGGEPPPTFLAEDHKAVQTLNKEGFPEHAQVSIRARRAMTMPAPTARGRKARG